MSIVDDEGECWIMESPDNGETITKRRQRSDDKLVLDSRSGEWFPIRDAVEIISRERKERDIRAEHPTVKEAWDHYQLLLNMVRNRNETKQV